MVLSQVLYWYYVECMEEPALNLQELILCSVGQKIIQTKKRFSPNNSTISLHPLKLSLGRGLRKYGIPKGHFYLPTMDFQGRTVDFREATRFRILDTQKSLQLPSVRTSPTVVMGAVVNLMFCRSVGNFTP